MIAGQNNNRQPPCFLSRIFISVIAGRCNNIHANLYFITCCFLFIHQVKRRCGSFS